MLYSTTTYTTTGNMPSKNLDTALAPFAVAIAVILASTGTYKLQYSLDAMDVADASATWFDSVNIPAGTAANAVDNFIVPVSRVRLVIAANGSGITMQIRQGMSIN